MKTQEKLLKSFNLINKILKKEPEKFVKSEPVGVIVITEENQKEINNLIELDFGNEYPSCGIKKEALKAGTIDNAIYDINNTKYIEEVDGVKMIKKGVSIIIQTKKDGTLDIYPNPDLFRNHKPVKDGSNFNKNITGNALIDKHIEFFNKEAIVEMYMAKDIKKYAKLGNNGTIKTRTGRIQRYDQKSFFAMEKDKNGNITKINLVQEDIDGNPIQYITLKKYKESASYDTSRFKSEISKDISIS